MVGEGVDAVRFGGFLADKGAAAAGNFAQVMIGGVVGGGVASDAGAAGEEGFGDA